MKRTIGIWIFFVLAFLGNIQGQGWFLDSSYVWTEIQPGFGFSVTKRYTLDSSPTLIDGKQYYEKLVSTTPSGNNWSPTQSFYRTDDFGKVYLSYQGNEKLIYDYGLNTNDSFLIPNGSDIHLVVDHIDTLQLENGERRKQMAMRCPNEGFIVNFWIEGLGGVNGVYGPFIEECLVDALIPQTLCILRNDTLLYDNPDYDSCWYIATATKNINHYQISVFPNPAIDQIQISGIENQSQEIIYNLTREVLYQGKDNPINVHGFPSGMYIVEVRRKGYYSIFVKFLKL